MTVDTLSLARELRTAELSPIQAEAIASAIGRAVVEGAATKSDLEQFGLRLEAKIEASRVNLMTWFVATQVALTALIIAAMKL